MSAEELPRQTRIGPCRLLRKIGSGGTGVVYLGELIDDRGYGAKGDRVAVKIIHPHIAADAEGFQRFEREAEVGAAITHPDVVRTFEAGSTSDGPIVHHFLVMEFLEGQTLTALLADAGRLPEPMVRDIGRQAATILAAIHAAELVHRDIKPSNLLLTPDSKIRVLDLGTARLLRPARDLTQAGTFVGTLLYAAPERLRGEVAGPAVDLYSLGAVLYQLATGVQPFDSDDVQVVLRRHLDEVPTRVVRLEPGLSPLLDELVAALLAKDPGQRPDAVTVAKVLEQGESSAWWKSIEPLTRADERRGRLHRIRIVREASLVGRERELRTLHDFYADARGGQGRVVWIDGEAGVGKTRLVDAFVAALEERGAEFHFLYGTYEPAQLGHERGAFADAVLGRFGRSALASALQRYLASAPGLASAFATFLNGDDVDGVTGFDSNVRDALFCQLAKSLAAERPVVWVVEDLHFSGRRGWDLVLALARITQERRVLLVLTSRPDSIGEGMSLLTRLGVLRRLKLGRLGPVEVAELLLRSLGSSERVEQLAPAVLRRSDGNPLFVLALAHDIRDRRTPGSGSIESGSDATEVPTSVREHLSSRLHSLSPSERAVLDLAAVQGFSFEPDLLARALSVPRLAVLQTLAAIERSSGLVRASGASLHFDHHLLQELLYADQSESLRVEHHAVLTSAMLGRLDETGGRSRVDPEVATFLAHHGVRGRRLGDAAPFLLRALEYISVHERGEIAVTLGNDALALIGDSDPALACDIRVHVAERLHLLGRPLEEIGAIEAALADARRIGDRLREGRCLLAHGSHLRSRGDLIPARAAMEAALAVAGDRRTEAKARLLLGMLLLATTEFDASLEHLTIAAALSQELGDAVGEGDAHRNLGRLMGLFSRQGEARGHFDRSLALYRRVGYRLGEGLSLGALGVLIANTGGELEAGVVLREHLRLCREVGHRTGESNALHYLGDNASECGRFDEARVYLAQSVALARECGERQVEMAACHSFGRMWLYSGRLVEAGELFASSAALLAEINELRWEASATIDYGLLALAEGHPDEAFHQIEGARARAAERRLRGQVTRAERELGNVALARGQFRQARDYFERSRDGSVELGERGPELLATLGLARTLLAVGDRAGARAGFEEVAAYGAASGLACFGRLAPAYLAGLGVGDPLAVDLAAPAYESIRIETHLVLAQAGRAGQLAAARSRLERMALFLPAAKQAGFWSGNPLARWLRELESTGCLSS